ncbi:replicative DNA helicase [Micromonospora rifamycinica]|uniref:Replicative DNA helicase n=2 Tax=Micromonospora rifamycinica TaxID=291594 RepID=A0A1C5JS18_9ACTN|nr:replicative DNA helicase [Micromonospora rifamycinica]SCG73352.1 replicative DNA helicase [Micromonospora rifamycinica]
MSVTDDMRAEPRTAGQSAPPPRDGQFDKTPPQDVAAEQCVLGGMLLSKDAIADVVEILKSTDFYRPVHATIFDAILDIYGRGEPADGITVAAALADSGDLARVGGAPYLHTCMAAVPTAANASYYARIVGERAVLRRLVEAGTRIVQLGYGTAAGGSRDVDDVVDLAQQAVYEITERRVSEDFAVLADMLQPTLDEIEAVGAQGGVMTGVPTGFTDLDRLLNGLHPGQLIIVAGRPGLGKALALDTPLPTPDGWTTMGEVQVGDRLLAADGTPTTVTAAFAVLVGRPCYEVEFSDGSVIVADAEHLWQTTHPAAPARVLAAVGPTGGDGCPAPAVVPARRESVLTTAEIAATLRTGPDAHPNHAVASCAPLRLPPRDLPVPPYALGRRLGDEGRPAGSLPRALHPVGYPQEHIPGDYLRGSEAQRRSLLAGLLDAAGTVTPTGGVRYSCASRRLAENVRELVVSLGHHCTVTARPVPGRTERSATTYTIDFVTADAVFRRADRAAAHAAHRRPGADVRAGVRYVVDVRPVASVPVRCVTVDNPEHLYLAGRSMIPTHNSTASMDFARNAAIRANQAAAIFSLEMSKVEIVMRLLSAEARVPLHVLRSGQLSDDDWTKLARCMGEISEAPLFVDDTPSMNLMEIRAKARRLKQKHDLKMIVVDYLQLMTSPKRTESRQQEVADLSRGLKLLAKEVECPVIAVSQLNRGPEQRTDKRPQLSDLRESGCLTAETRLIRADTNAEVTMGELLKAGTREIPVWALDENLRYSPRTMTHVFPSGRREVFRLTLASGKQIDATANHPFLTFAGWVPLGELAVGARLATPRHLPPPLATRSWVEAEVVLLAHLLGDGSFVRRQPIRYASRDEENLVAVAEAAKHFGISAVRDEYEAARVTTLRLPAPYRLARGRRNPVAEWLDGLGLFGLRSHEKFIPQAIFSLPKEQITLFLRHLWSTDGSIHVNKSGRGGRVYFSSTSRRMLEDISRLLLRYGITARLKVVPVADHRPQYTLDISGRDDQLRFLREIGVHGERAAACEALLAVLETVVGNTNVDTVPTEVWSQVREVLVERGMSHREFARAMGTQFCGSALWKRAPSRSRLARIASVLDAADLELHATNDIFWDEITSIESLGEQDVFDATVLGTHNFVANGIATHNSIEQDADVVILLHRDDYYDKESPRAGEADFIVAKHRNGPTDSITVAAQLHLSRFVDMAIV